jgi:ribonuclease HII
MKIAGVDEVGRGPIAGPVVAAAVILPTDFSHPLVRDSKQLSAKQRATVEPIILEHALAWSIVSVGPRRIEAINIRQASVLAMALAAKRVSPEHVLVDGNVPIPLDISQETIIGGDRLNLSIAAASILAKEWRDRLMKTLAHYYPGYGLEKHMGYPTRAHKEAVERLGPSTIHRKTFKGVAEFFVSSSSQATKGHSQVERQSRRAHCA